jgi:hypothetical protein
MDYKKSTGKKNVAKSSKGALQCRIFAIMLISVSREPVVQTNHPKELEVPANLE